MAQKGVSILGQRSRTIEVTVQGKERLKKALLIWRNVQHVIEKKLDADDLDALQRIMDKPG